MTRTRTRFAVTAVAAALGALILSGCSAAQQAVENAAGNAIGGDVSIGESGLSVTDSEGNTVQLGSDVALPENWPAEVPAFDGGSLVTVVVSGNGASANAAWTTTSSPEDALASYASALEAAGYTQGQTTSAGGMSSATYTGSGYTVTVLSVPGDGGATLTVDAQKG